VNVSVDGLREQKAFDRLIQLVGVTGQACEETLFFAFGLLVRQIRTLNRPPFPAGTGALFRDEIDSVMNE